MTDALSLDRRDLFKSGGAAAATVALAAPLTGLMARQAAAAAVDSKGAQLAPEPSPYGDIAPVNDLATGLPLLQLPSGFSYRSFSWTGDPMNDGQPVPGNHDGMAVVQAGGGRNGQHVLIRNHELGGGTPLLPKNPDGSVNAAAIYEAATSAGGCTVLKVANGQLVDHRATIGGTLGNCAGGASLWSTWLTCEETIAGVDNTPGLTKKHGYVFEVSPDPAITRGDPILDMGRMPHEAVALDAVNGDVFLTEDNRNYSGFYRYRPNDTARVYGALGRGGVLEAAKVAGVEKANLLNLADPRPSSIATVGQTLQIEWVRVLNPDASPVTTHVEDGADNPAPAVNARVSGPFSQARAAGALRMSRGEGIWWDRAEDAAYVVDTSFGYEGSGSPPRAGRGFGAVWVYKPDRANRNRGTLTLIYAAATRIAGNNPDNITISPRGGALFMEDGSAVVDQYGAGNRLMGLTNAGAAYIFAKNNVNLTAAQVAAAGKAASAAGDFRGREFAGGTFDPTGRTLYVNIQSPGITFAISGPWSRGNL